VSRLRNLSIGLRLALAFGAVSFACLVVAFVGFRGTIDLEHATHDVAEAASSLSMLGTVAQDSASNGRDVARHLYVYDGDLAEQDTIAKQIAERESHAGAMIKKIAAIHPDDAALWAQLDKSEQAFADARDEAIKRSRTETIDNVGDRDDSRGYYLSDVKATEDAHTALLHKINGELETDSREMLEGAEATGASTERLILIVAAIATLIGAVLSFTITRTVTRPVQVVVERLAFLRDRLVAELAGGINAMAQGDLTKDVVVEAPRIEDAATDELGQVADAVDAIRDQLVESVQSYNATTEALRDLVGAVQSNAGVLSAASEQMASSSEEAGRAVGEIASAVSDVAQGAERQVRSVEEAKQASEEVGEATRASAASAQQTAVAAEQAREVAREGEQAVAQATEAMRAVRESSAQVTDAMQGLAAKSEQIGGIVATITGIAGQTNLLALNAAIEAARAGEQGRGFAVVAEEVRKLAEESQDAAASIASLVEEIQAETSQAVAVVEDGAVRSDEGAATVEQARDAFARIGESVEDMTGRVEAIAAAVQQIAAGAEKVSEDMSEVAAVAEQSSASSEQVSASTQETSASTQEIASSAQQLAGTATELEELVGRFRLTT
jgi:methyl-accepting chemotaxis protein